MILMPLIARKTLLSPRVVIADDTNVFADLSLLTISVFFYIMDKVWLRILEKKELENLLQKFDTT